MDITVHYRHIHIFVFVLSQLSVVSSLVLKTQISLLKQEHGVVSFMQKGLRSFILAQRSSNPEAAQKI